MTWVTALVFLLVALYAVAVRREVYDLGKRIGAIEADLRETRCANDNRELLKEKLLSPADLIQRARDAGVPVDQPETPGR
jgi:cell division protein FtsL